MNTLSNAYTYSKNKSQAMFSSQKPKKLIEEKKGCPVMKTCRAKYETVKNASCVYMKNIYNMVKSTGSDVYTHLSTFTFNKNGKYADYPWYTRLYLTLKDNIKRIMNIEDGDIFMNAAEEKVEAKEMQREEPHSTVHTTLDAPNKLVSDEEHSTRNAFVSQLHNGVLFQRNKNYLKRTNSEVLKERVNVTTVEKTYSSNFNLATRSRTASLINSIMSLNKFTHTFEEEKAVQNTENVTETRGNDDINDTSTTVDHLLEANTTELSVATKIPLSNNSDSDKTSISEITDSKKKNFNIKNAWTKFNNLLI